MEGSQQKYLLKPFFNPFIEIIILAVLYAGSARVCQFLAIPPGNITPVWLPSGIILSAVLLRGYRLWPGIWLGAFAGNVWAYLDFETFSNLGAALFSGTANGFGDTICALSAAFLIKKTTKTRVPFSRFRHTIYFILFGAIMGPFISALFGVTSLHWSGIISGEKYLSGFITWWVGDGVGVLILTPLIVLGALKKEDTFSEQAKNLTEKILFWILLLIFSVLSLSLSGLYLGHMNIALFFLIPVILWGIIRFSQRTAVTVIFVIALIAVITTASGFSVFTVGDDFNHTLVEIQLFLAVLSTGTLLLTGTFYERDAAMHALIKNETELQQYRSDLEDMVEKRTAELVKSNDHCVLEAAKRELAEEILQAGEQQYRELFNNIHNGVAIYEPIDDCRDFIIRNINKAGEKISRVKGADIIGKSILEVFPGVKDLGLFDILAAVSKTGIPQDLPASPYKDGRLSQWVNNFVYRIPSGEVVAVYEDVTRRKLTEEALRESGEFNRRIIESSSDCIKVIDRDGYLLFMTRIGQQLMEIQDIKKYLNKSWINFWKNSGQDAARAAVIKAAGGKMETFRAFSPTETGKPKWWDVTVSPIVEEEGTIDRLLVMAKDITIRKEAEENIIHLNTQLELRVKERTAQLEEAINELESFAYSVSHDLRAPLRHIDGFISLLQKKSREDFDIKSKRYVAIIAESAKKMDSLISDLLMFSRISRNEMKKRPVNINTIINEILNDYNAELKDRGVQWNITKLPIVLGDRSMLRLVMENLISNSLKFTRNEPAAVIDIGFIEEDAHKEATIFIRDNGVGFNMDYAQKLFGVFQRLHSDHDFEGTGIGLATVERIIRKHGGYIRAEGEEGHGATFYFSLLKAE
ncbi:MAG: PAS domain-containing protein [bacterium]|nr:PAS domain-containing protein [bacterium]